MDTSMDIHYFDEITTIPTEKLVTKSGLVFYIKTLKVNGKEGDLTLTFFSDYKGKLAFKRGKS